MATGRADSGPAALCLLAYLTLVPFASARGNSPPTRPSGVHTSLQSATGSHASRFINSAGMTLAWIPPGSFHMGTLRADAGPWLNETPRHRVCLSYGFWMGTAEVTLDELMRIRPDDYDFVSGGAPAPRSPAMGVTKQQAIDFCDCLTTLDASAGILPKGWRYRLPSEAEWEYACRAGTTTAFAFGASLTTTQADFAATDTKPWDGPLRAVMAFPPNQRGLHDMHGGALEWCLDEWHSNYLGAPSDGRPWMLAAPEALSPVPHHKPQPSGGFGPSGVARGGWAGAHIDRLRSAARERVYYNSNLLQGFRVVLSNRWCKQVP